MSVSFGMNTSKTGKRFGRVADAFKTDSMYWGERGEWFIIAATHRDADSLSRSNFQVLQREVGDTALIERATHWAVGWIDYLIVAPDDRKALRVAITQAKRYEQYPVLDESHWSELEYNEAWEFITNELKQFDNWQSEFEKHADDIDYGSDSSIWEAIEATRNVLKKDAA